MNVKFCRLNSWTLSVFKVKIFNTWTVYIQNKSVKHRNVNQYKIFAQFLPPCTLYEFDSILWKDCKLETSIAFQGIKYSHTDPSSVQDWYFIEEFLPVSAQGENSFFWPPLGFWEKTWFVKGPVKLIKRVKIAHSFLQSLSKQFHVIILSLPM